MKKILIVVSIGLVAAAVIFLLLNSRQTALKNPAVKNLKTNFVNTDNSGNLFYRHISVNFFHFIMIHNLITFK